MATDYYVVQNTAGTVFGVKGVSNNYVWPYPTLPGYVPSYPLVTTWPSMDDMRLAALEARIAKLERENKRLRRGLGNLYRRAKEASDGR